MSNLDAIIAEASAFSEYDPYTCDAFQRIVTLTKEMKVKMEVALEGFEHAPKNHQIIVSKGQIQRIRALLST